MVWWFLHSQLLWLCGEVVTSIEAEVMASCTFSYIKGTHNPGDCDSSRISVHPEEGLIIP